MDGSPPDVNDWIRPTPGVPTGVDGSAERRTHHARMLGILHEPSLVLPMWVNRIYRCDYHALGTALRIRSSGPPVRRGRALAEPERATLLFRLLNSVRDANPFPFSENGGGTTIQDAPCLNAFSSLVGMPLA